MEYRMHNPFGCFPLLGTFHGRDLDGLHIPSRAAHAFLPPTLLPPVCRILTSPHNLGWRQGWGAHISGRPASQKLKAGHPARSWLGHPLKPLTTAH